LPDRAGELFLQLAEASRQQHTYVNAETLYTSALEQLDGRGQSAVAARRGRGIVRYRIGRYEDALEDFEQARRLAHASGSQEVETGLLLDQATALDWMNEFDRAAALAAQAKALAESPSPALSAQLLMAHGRTLWRKNQLAEARPLLERA